MKYLVELTSRALRDIEAIYNYVEGDDSQHAFAWFNRLAKTIYSLERFPGRGLGHFRLSRFVPQLNIRLQVLHHFLELRDIQRLRAVADGLLRRGMHLHD